MPEFSKLLESGELHEVNGEWAEAELIYRSVLQTDSLNEIVLLRLAEVVANQGRLSDASQIYREILNRNAQCLDAVISLGITLARLQQLDEAVEQFQNAIRLAPHSAKAFNNLGVAFGELGNFGSAIEAVRTAIDIQPQYAEAHYNLGTLYSNSKQKAVAGDCFRDALRIRPNYVEAMTNLGLNLLETRRASEAVIVLNQALRLQPSCVGASNNLGLALTDCGRFDQAIATWERLLREDPNHADYHSNLGSTYDQMGRVHEALACYEHAIRLKPDDASIRWNRSLALLHAGDFVEGWKEYEWRWRRDGSHPRILPQPMWDGSALNGRTIFVHMEQGLGDMIMFSRYFSILKEKGGKVIVECPDRLFPLFQKCSGVDEVVKEGEELAPFHVHVPIMSLPRILGTTLKSIPSNIPYLHANAQLIKKWGDRLKHIRGKRVGICWQGNREHRWDHHRSISSGEFKSLSNISGITLISLQPFEACDDPSLRITVFPDLDSEAGFEDSAAILQHLDLVITCDTSVAHLAGAMGIHVWLLRSKIGDWRWLTSRSDSPWYPSMRIYRQEHVGNWRSTLEIVKHDILEEIVSSS